MYSTLNLTSPPIKLARFPKDRRETLLPYDAADELIMEWWQQTHNQQAQSIWILNDSFGALTCFFHQQSSANLVHITDSFLAEQALCNNLENNRLDEERIECWDCLESWPHLPTLVVLKVPKNLSLLEHQLARLCELPTGTPILIGARIKDLPAKAIKLMKQAFGNMVPEPARRKSRIMHASVTGEAMDLPSVESWPVPEFNLELANHANVFSRKSLDLGARILLEHLPQTQAGSRVVDLGCGNGVLALAMARKQPDNHYSLIDESHMSIASAKANVHHNMPELADNFSFYCQHGLMGWPAGSLDLVICNPPFQQQQAITDEIAWQMFHQAHQALRIGGKLRIVGNRHLGYHLKLERLFGAVQMIASNAKFVILESEKK